MDLSGDHRTNSGRTIVAMLVLALIITAAPAIGCSGGQGGSDTTKATPTATDTSGTAGTGVDITTSTAGASSGSAASLGTVVTTKSGRGSWRRLSPAELAGMLEHKDFFLVNVHVPYAGEINGTDLFLPYDQADPLMGKLPADKGAKIVVYCRSARMSTIAADVWADAGYTNLYELEGGFEAWQAAGYPLVINPQ